MNSWKEKFLDKLVIGDSLVLLKEIPDGVVDLVITSPPYFQQRDYGVDGIGMEESLEEYLSNLHDVFRECIRIVKPTGHIVINLGDKYEKGSLLMVPWRFAIRLLDTEPVYLINVITWVKTNPVPRQFKDRLVPSTEPFFIFTKSRKNYYFNKDAFLSLHALLNKRKKHVSSSRIGQRYFELIEKSSLTEKEKEEAKRELVSAIEEVKSGKILGFRMKIRGIHSMPFGGQDGGRKRHIENKGFAIIKILGKHMKKDVIESPVETIKGIKHPAIYPEFVVGEIMKLLSPNGGVVLDPFVGSGTTAVVAKKLGRHYIGIDLNAEYIKYAQERIKNVSSMLIDYVL